MVSENAQKDEVARQHERIGVCHIFDVIDVGLDGFCRWD